MKRNSSIEMLKIIAIIIIIISHSVPYGVFSNYQTFMDLNNCTMDLQRFILSFFRHFGSIGNCIFIVCSCYFLTDSKRIKPKKIIKLIVDATVISTIIMLLFRFGFGINNVFNNKELIKMIMPIVFSSYWFISAYILVYSITPLLNIALDSLNKKEFSIYLIIIIMILIANSIKGGILFFNELLGFIFIYIIIYYLKKYYNHYMNDKKKNIIICISSLCTFIILMASINFFGMKISFFSNKLMLLNVFYNPVIIIFAVSLFNIFNSKRYNNSIVNYISSLSLLIYVIHGQQFIVGYSKGLYYDHMILNYGYNNIIVLTLLLSCIFFIGSVIVSIVYKSIDNFIFGRFIIKKQT